MKIADVTGKADIFKYIPRDTEFDYYSKKKLEKSLLFLNGKSLAQGELLDELVLPQAHVGRMQDTDSMEDWQKCPDDCKEKVNCSDLREVFYITETIRENWKTS